MENEEFFYINSSHMSDRGGVGDVHLSLNYLNFNYVMKLKFGPMINSERKETTDDVIILVRDLHII